MAAIDIDRATEEPCPTCGVSVRRGMVRCWSCSGFMRGDIAAAYERMRQQRPQVQFQPLPEHSSDRPGDAPTSGNATGEADFDLIGSTFEAESGGEGGGDFELGATVNTLPANAPRSGSASAFSGRATGSGPAPATPEAPKEPAKPEASKPQPVPAETPAAPSPQPVTPAADGSPPAKPDTAKSDTAKPARPRPDEGGPAHSEATAGDALLQVALEEEAETERRGKSKASKRGFDPVAIADGWLITCPCPARIRIKIKEQHRGRTGKCPNPQCGTVFTMPSDLPAPDAAAPATTGEPAVDAAPSFPADPADKAGAFTHWLRDVRLHAVKPAKAKRKPGGHEKDFAAADLGFSAITGLLVVGLTAKSAGLVSLSKKKPEQVREEVLAELRAGKPAGELSAEPKFLHPPETLGKLFVEFPPAYEHESTFAGVPIFGDGRVAVKLPPGPAPDELHFVSLTLTQYRRLKELAVGLFDVQGLGLGCPIPEDETVTLICHYSETPLTVLRQPAYHQADPAIELEPVGYRCESCGLIVSEDARKKEKIGGLDGKKLAGAKCPKCKGKFGNNPLYAIKPKAMEPAAG